jgi:sulfur carrier protein ThiS
MTASIRLSDSLKNLLGSEGLFTIEAGHSVREAIVSLGINPDLVAVVSVGDEMQSKDYLIQEGDTVRLLAVIGGG